MREPRIGCRFSPPRRSAGRPGRRFELLPVVDHARDWFPATLTLNYCLLNVMDSNAENVNPCTRVQSQEKCFRGASFLRKLIRCNYHLCQGTGPLRVRDVDGAAGFPQSIRIKSRFG